ncbi:MAG: lipase family protein [Acidimicrobiales bacterium]|nr:lipase family protein [Acidimicrobiales bacterium]
MDTPRRLGPPVRRRGGTRVSAQVSAIVVAVAVLVAACGSSGPASLAPIPAPRGLPSFFSVPQPLPKTGPGTLLKSERIAVSGLHGTAYRVMYLSESVTGKPVAVTGLVVVPDRPVPAGGYPVVTWGHGTDGMADRCAPSLNPSSAVPLADDLLDRGWEVTASDYQGEGTPGLLPYLVGVSAARNTIDIVRAARHLPAARASDNYVVWGHSEGGQTAMFALHIASSYAPGLHLKGVVAGAPPSQFYAIYQFLKTSPYRYYLFMAAGGFNAAYGDKAAPLDQVLTPLAVTLLPDLDKGCSDYVGQVTSKYTLSQLTKGDPIDIPTWKTLMNANDPGTFTTAGPVPLLIIQGGSDEQIPVVSTALLADHLCTLGQDLERWIYPGQSHAGVIAPSANDMVHWISDRFAGGPDPDPYAPTGLPGIQTKTCP